MLSIFDPFTTPTILNSVAQVPGPDIYIDAVLRCCPLPVTLKLLHVGIV